MRRGLIAVGGRVGDYAAARMIGGTLLARGGCGTYPGYGMRRGSLLLALPPAAPLQLFADNGPHDLPWLGLLARHLAGLGWQGEAFPTRVRHLTGDVTAGGKGEMLLAG
jgi:formylmethanofuran dehydrogenase subunit C